MKRVLAFVFSVLMLMSVLTGCSGDGEAYTERTYTADDEQIRGVVIDVRDRFVEVIPSADEKIHIDYSDSAKEGYDISVSEENLLTMTLVSSKEWTDYIGGKAPANVRKITLQLPDALLDSLSISTTNEDVDIAALAVSGSVYLNANGGNISFDELTAGEKIALDVKNGNISGAVSGSYDDYSIKCNIKKGDSNLPENKEGGSKLLTINANNGDVEIDIR
jgi:hypothetical protein